MGVRPTISPRRFRQSEAALRAAAENAGQILRNVCKAARTSVLKRLGSAKGCVILLGLECSSAVRSVGAKAELRDVVARYEAGEKRAMASNQNTAFLGK